MSKCLSFLTTNVSNNLPRAYFSKIKVGILRKKQQIIIKDLKMFFFYSQVSFKGWKLHKCIVYLFIQWFVFVFFTSSSLCMYFLI